MSRLHPSYRRPFSVSLGQKPSTPRLNDPCKLAVIFTVVTRVTEGLSFVSESGKQSSIIQDVHLNPTHI